MLFSRLVVSNSATPWTAAHQASWSFISWSLFELVHRVSDAVQPSHPLPSPSPPAFNLSNIRVFATQSALRIRWPKYWSFSFNISPSKEHPGLLSFRMDWLDLLVVQWTLNSSPTSQFKSINPLALSFLYSLTLTSIHDYWKTIALTRWTFVGKVMSLFFNMPPRLVKLFFQGASTF